MATFTKLSAVLFATSLILPTHAWAQAQNGDIDEANEGSGGIAEIVVTAQKREQNIQQVPVAIDALSASALANRGISSVEDLGRSLPGVQIPVVSGVAAPFVRGVGSTIISIGAESSVAVYVDGVYFSRLPSGIFGLSNVERVEVLKGPQGTLFGRNATAGVIQIITKDPSYTPSMSASLGYGSFDTVEGSLYATSGLSDRVAMDIAVSGRHQGTGWGKNVSFPDTKSRYYSNFSVRSKLLFEASETTRFTLSGVYSYSLSDIQGSTTPGTTSGFVSAPYDRMQTLSFYDQNNNDVSTSKANMYGVTAKVEQELSFANVTSVTAYIKTINRGVADGDYGPRPDILFRYGGPVNQFTQEVQLSSLKSSNPEWTIGAYYYNTLSKYDDKTLFSSPSGALDATFGPGGLVPIASVHAKSYALFGQMTYEVLPGLRATGGLRYTWDRQNAQGEFRSGLGGPAFLIFPDSTDKLNKLTFRAAVDYRVGRAVLLYGSVSRGFKSSVYNLLTYDPVPTKPEILTAYEGGFKSTLFGGKLRLNGAAFWYDMKSPQVTLLSNSTLRFSNAGAARIKGVELGVDAVLAKGLTGRVGMIYTQAKYTDYPGAPSGATPDGTALQTPPYGAVAPLRDIDATGNFLPYSPEWSANLGADYEFSTSQGSWVLSADALYKDKYYFEPDNFLRQKPLILLNAQIKYMPREGFAIRAWGKNLAGEKIIEKAFTQSGPSGFPYSPGAPRTYGIAFDFSF